jgi:hypothetical protein
MAEAIPILNTGDNFRGDGAWGHDRNDAVQHNTH